MRNRLIATTALLLLLANIHYECALARRDVKSNKHIQPNISLWKSAFGILRVCLCWVHSIFAIYCVCLVSRNSILNFEKKIRALIYVSLISEMSVRAGTMWFYQPSMERKLPLWYILSIFRGTAQKCLKSKQYKVMNNIMLLLYR